MSMLPLGWAIVHSLWQCTLIAGVTAMVLSLLDDRRARARYAVACAGLASMALAGLVTPFVGITGAGFAIRYQVAATVDSAIALPTLISWARMLFPAAAVLWLAGVGVRLVQLSLECRRVRSLRRDVEDAGAATRAAVAEIGRRMSIRTPVHVSRSPHAEVPMVLGGRRPVILLPIGSAEALAPAQLRGVLAHELAHVARRDHLVNFWLMLAETLLFHHPAARWLARRVRAEREYCCDDAALALERDPRAYAGALAALEDARVDCRPMLAAASGTLLDRIQRIAGRPRVTLTPVRGAAVLLACAAIAGTILSVAISLPPSLPDGSRLRRRMPPPQDALPPAGQPSLPRTPIR